MQRTQKKNAEALREEHQTLTLAIDLFERLAFTDLPVEMSDVEEAAKRLRLLYAERFLAATKGKGRMHAA
ncbi:MAG: hypothetical protein C0605_03640 [Hyphomicrobiales bacterium]|nr:MAG: hypothetical protein C0605_03640 [Hyphomicrobiales bacterium]